MPFKILVQFFYKSSILKPRSFCLENEDGIVDEYSKNCLTQTIREVSLEQCSKTDAFHSKDLVVAWKALNILDNVFLLPVFEIVWFLLYKIKRFQI